jgi:hypothetical protein
MDSDSKIDISNGDVFLSGPLHAVGQFYHQKIGQALQSDPQQLLYKLRQISNLKVSKCLTKFDAQVQRAMK